MTGSVASRAVLCAARPCAVFAVPCRAALVLASLTATPAPASAATTTTVTSPARARRRRRPRAAARPLARRNSASPVPSGGYRPGSPAQTRAACPAAASWTSAVQQRAVAAAGAPPRRVLGELAVQDHAGLVFGQPPPQPRPGPEQDVVRDLGAVGVQRDQAVPGERLQDRADLGPLRRGPPGAQVADADRPAGRPAVRPGAGQPPEDLPGDSLLVLGQAAVGRLGADLHGPGDPGLVTGVQIRLPGQLVALAMLPGRGHGLRQQRQDRAARRLLPGRAQVGQDGVGQARLDGQPARLGRAGDHAAQLSFGHRPGDDLVAFHERDQLGVGRAPVPVVAAYRDDREQRGLCARGGRPGRGRAHGLDERGPLEPGLLVPGREDLLELVDDQDQPGRPGGLRDLAEQQVRIARRAGQAVADHRGIAVAQLPQLGGQLGQRAGARGHADPRPRG